MATLTPIIALVDDATLDRLQPVIDGLIAKMEVTEPYAGEQLLMRLNGWTPDMLAWGIVLHATALAEPYVAP